MTQPAQRGTVALGTMTFGDTVDAAGARDLVELALSHGVTHLDTANGYAGGASESMLADALTGVRDRVFLATKVGIPQPGDTAPPLSHSNILSSVQASLARLGTDYVDLLYLHQPDYDTEWSETLDAVAELLAAGRIRSFGVSNHAAWQVAGLAELSRARGLPVPAVAQQLYNLIARRIEDEYAAFAAREGVATFCYNPLAGGLLTGRYGQESSPEEGRFATSALSGMYRERYWRDELFAAVESLRKLAAEAGVSMAELAIRWLIGRPTVDGLVLGASGVRHLKDNLASVQKGPLPADLKQACADVTEPLWTLMPRYQR